MLRRDRVTGLVVVGAQTDCCIDATCRQAAILGYDTKLVADAHGTWDTEGETAQEIVARYNTELGEVVGLTDSESVRFHGGAPGLPTPS